MLFTIGTTNFTPGEPETRLETSPDLLGCWSCGVKTLRPDGFCADCAAIDPGEVPDLSDPSWPGYTGNGLATEDVLVAPPNAKNVTPRDVPAATPEDVLPAHLADALARVNRFLQSPEGSPLFSNAAHNFALEMRQDLLYAIEVAKDLTNASWVEDPRRKGTAR
jgi:hypothetical protein